MAKSIKKKAVTKKPVEKKVEAPNWLVAKEVDQTKPGFSNVHPDSPQAKPFVRTDPLPSQKVRKLD